MNSVQRDISRWTRDVQTELEASMFGLSALQTGLSHQHQLVQFNNQHLQSNNLLAATNNRLATANNELASSTNQDLVLLDDQIKALRRALRESSATVANLEQSLVNVTASLEHQSRGWSVMARNGSWIYRIRKGLSESRVVVQIITAAQWAPIRRGLQHGRSHLVSDDCL